MQNCPFKLLSKIKHISVSSKTYNMTLTFETMTVNSNFLLYIEQTTLVCVQEDTLTWKIFNQYAEHFLSKNSKICLYFDHEIYIK